MNESDADSDEASADDAASDEGNGLTDVTGDRDPSGVQAFMNGDNWDHFLQSAPYNSLDFVTDIPSAPYSAPAAFPNFNADIFDFQLPFVEPALAQTSAPDPSSMLYNVHHEPPSNVFAPMRNALGFPTDQYLNFADLNHAHNQVAVPFPMDDPFQTDDFGMPLWQSSGVLPQPQDFAPALQTGPPNTIGFGSSAVPTIPTPSQHADVVAPRPQRPWDTPAVLTGVVLGDSNHPNVSAPVQGQLPVHPSLHGPMQPTQPMIAQAPAQMHMTRTETQTWLQCSYTQLVCEQHSRTTQTGYYAPPGLQRTQRQYARLGQEPYRNQYHNRRHSVDALLNRLHPEQLGTPTFCSIYCANKNL